MARSARKVPKKTVPHGTPKTMVFALRDDHSKMVAFRWDPRLGDHVGSEITTSQARRLEKAIRPPIDRPSNTPGKKYHCEWSDLHNQYICDLVDA